MSTDGAKPPEGKSTQELRSGIERTRAEITETLGAIESRLNPTTVKQTVVEGIQAVKQAVTDLGRLDLLVANRAGPVRIDIERKRFGNADRIGELDGAAARKARGYDVLCEIARGISC